MAEQRWYEGGVAWVGVHARRTDLMLKCTTANCKEGLAVEQALPLSRFTDVMKAVSQLTPGRMPRFYLATDDPEAEASMQQELMEWATAGSGAVNGSAMATNSHSARHGGLAPVVSMPKAVRDASGDWLAMRSVVSGVQEAVADLYLLR